MHKDRHPIDPGQMHSRARVHLAGRRWQPHWLTDWLAPEPTWLERLERGSPLPRLLRR